jgi:hypothetical protein
VFLDWLTAQGVTIDQVVAAEREGALAGLVADRQLRPGPRFTARQVAARHGLPVEEVLALSLAVGLPPHDADDPFYSEDDSVTFESYETASQLFGGASAKRFVRVVGSSLARIAEAAVSMFQVNIEGPLRASGGTDLDVARENVRAIATLGQVRPHAAGALHGAHGARDPRLRDVRPRKSVDTATLAVGLRRPGRFTTITHRMTPKELAAVIERFEETAYDVATERDGRVVKLIGDEVMFVTIDPRGCVRHRADAVRALREGPVRHAARRARVRRAAAARRRLLRPGRELGRSRRADRRAERAPHDDRDGRCRRRRTVRVDPAGSAC